MPYRKVDVQTTFGRLHYRAHNAAKGETYECADITPLLRKMVLHMQGQPCVWTMESFDPNDNSVEETNGITPNVDAKSREDSRVRRSGTR